jgi:hypothetical protein
MQHRATIVNPITASNGMTKSDRLLTGLSSLYLLSKFRIPFFVLLEIGVARGIVPVVIGIIAFFATDAVVQYVYDILQGMTFRWVCP